MPGKRKYFSIPPEQWSESQQKRADRDAWYRSAHSQAGQKFVEVPATIAPEVRAFAKSKTAHIARNAQLGESFHHARQATWAAHRNGLISKSAALEEATLHKLANIAKHHDRSFSSQRSLRASRDSIKKPSLVPDAWDDPVESADEKNLLQPLSSDAHSLDRAPVSDEWEHADTDSTPASVEESPMKLGASPTSCRLESSPPTSGSKTIHPWHRDRLKRDEQSLSRCGREAICAVDRLPMSSQKDSLKMEAPHQACKDPTLLGLRALLRSLRTATPDAPAQDYTGSQVLNQLKDLSSDNKTAEKPHESRAVFSGFWPNFAFACPGLDDLNKTAESSQAGPGWISASCLFQDNKTAEGSLVGCFGFPNIKTADSYSTRRFAEDATRESASDVHDVLLRRATDAENLIEALRHRNSQLLVECAALRSSNRYLMSQSECPYTQLPSLVEGVSLDQSQTDNRLAVLEAQVQAISNTVTRDKSINTSLLDELSSKINDRSFWKAEIKMCIDQVSSDLVSNQTAAISLLKSSVIADLEHSGEVLRALLDHAIAENNQMLWSKCETLFREHPKELESAVMKLEGAVVSSTNSKVEGIRDEMTLIIDDKFTQHALVVDKMIAEICAALSMRLTSPVDGNTNSSECDALTPSSIVPVTTDVSEQAAVTAHAEDHGTDTELCDTVNSHLQLFYVAPETFDWVMKSVISHFKSPLRTRKGFSFQQSLKASDPRTTKETRGSTSSSSPSNLLPPGWQVGFDDTHGMHYFYNHSTGESSWDFPRP
eukprot:TRINITY_DN1183_c0_g1_i5.p1 TRINITY_DN1183_c0_g1~~TRINITY_DN1183_c0_g1_i5.p1  ORF type:complete len:845 (+),score=86.54 TRINITY_DN1183_c0_g1_i5:220-2535(+)